MKRKKLIHLFMLIILALCLITTALFVIPDTRDRITWHIDEIILRIKYQLNPPTKPIFVPSEAGTPISLQIEQPAVTSTEMITSTETSIASPPTTMPTLTATIPITPIPEKIALSGIRYEDQHGRYNYCAPANLAMALSYWGWQGNRDIVGPFLKPDEKDKNVMPYEMVDYVNNQTDLKALERVGGDIDLLKRFIASGYPVLVEKGTYLRDLTGVVSWMGHYQVITGYDDTQAVFIAQDSFTKPDQLVEYNEMINAWRAFNYTYIIIYPPEKEADVIALLGDDADETTNYQNAAMIASNEVYGLSSIDQYFAWFNRGTNLMNLQDYAGAALAYDEAFAVYPQIPEQERPWRMLWYQTGPYFAYFYVERYYDVLYLSDGTLQAMPEDKNIEESYYWRGMAKAALGDTQAAIEDFQTSLQLHEGFEPAIYQLRLLGVEYP